jgi:hypothetical protein
MILSRFSAENAEMISKDSRFEAKMRVRLYIYG